MFCGKCGEKLPEGAMVCPRCGEKVGKDIEFSDVRDYAGQRVQQMSQNIEGRVNSFHQSQLEQKTSRVVRDVEEMFVNSDEQQVAVIGGGYLSSMLHSGIMGKGFGVLTNRRLYFRGKCFHKMAGRYVKTDEDCIVDLQDVTSSGFTYTRRIWMVVLAVIFIVVSIPWMIADEFSGIPLFLLIAGLALLVAYWISKITMYTVTFAGGSLSIRASSYGVTEVKAFDRALHMEKDSFLAENLYKS